MQMVKLGMFSGALAVALISGLPAAQGFTLKPYGYIKADLTMDMGNPSQADGGFGTNYVRWIDPVDDRPTTWGLTARQSRLGFDFVADPVGETTVLGKIETDFTNASAEHANVIKLRKAYLKVATPSLELLAGQEADIFSPLVPDTVNYLVGWWAGNIGFRRPQVRLTYKLGLGEQTGIDITAGVERTIGVNSARDNYDVGFPLLAGRIGFRSPALSLGISGHYGKERGMDGATVLDETFETMSANLDLVIPLGKMLAITGEAYYGKNLASYFGGIGQGIVPKKDAADEREELTDMGFWAQLAFTPTESFIARLGHMSDMPDEDQLGAGTRTSNTCTFLNLNYMMVKDVWVALEGSLWKTEYKEVEDKVTDDYRGQLAFIYNFK